MSLVSDRLSSRRGRGRSNAEMDWGKEGCKQNLGRWIAAAWGEIQDEESKNGRETGGRKSVEQTECRVCVERKHGGSSGGWRKRGRERGGGVQSYHHQYSRLVHSSQPRQMRAYIREEVDQLKTHKPLPLSPYSPVLYFLHIMPQHPPPMSTTTHRRTHIHPPLSQNTKTIWAAVAHDARSLPNT